MAVEVVGSCYQIIFICISLQSCLQVQLTTSQVCQTLFVIEYAWWYLFKYSLETHSSLFVTVLTSATDKYNDSRLKSSTGQTWDELSKEDKSTYINKAIDELKEERYNNNNSHSKEWSEISNAQQREYTALLRKGVWGIVDQRRGLVRQLNFLIKTKTPRHENAGVISVVTQSNGTKQSSQNSRFSSDSDQNNDWTFIRSPKQSKAYANAATAKSATSSPGSSGNDDTAAPSPSLNERKRPPESSNATANTNTATDANVATAKSAASSPGSSGNDDTVVPNLDKRKRPLEASTNTATSTNASITTATNAKPSTIVIIPFGSEGGLKLIQSQPDDNGWYNRRTAEEAKLVARLAEQAASGGQLPQLASNSTQLKQSFNTNKSTDNVTKNQALVRASSKQPSKPNTVRIRIISLHIQILHFV